MFLCGCGRLPWPPVSACPVPLLEWKEEFEEEKQKIIFNHNLKEGNKHVYSVHNILCRVFSIHEIVDNVKTFQSRTTCILQNTSSNNIVMNNCTYIQFSYWATARND